MAIRIGEHVLGGELRNTSRNSVHGWIEFAPDWGVRVELAGNLKGQFAGKRFRFRVNRPEDEQISEEDLPEIVHRLADRQIGAIGDVLLHQRKILTDSDQEAMRHDRMDEPVSFEIKDVLYVEWFGPNGRVVAEIVDPRIEFLSDEAGEVTSAPSAKPLDDSEVGSTGPSITSIRLNDEGDPVMEEVGENSVETGDEYGLFDRNLDQHIRQALAAPAEQPECGNRANDGRRERSWDEVIPGIDPETKAMYEQWDEIYGGEKDELVSNLFDPPLQLPAIDSVTTDEQAEPILYSIIGRLAMLNVAFDLCDHATPLTALRCLVEEVLPTAHVHPNLADSDIVVHYSMYESCADCEAEFEAEYEKRVDETKPEEGC